MVTMAALVDVPDLRLRKKTEIATLNALIKDQDQDQDQDQDRVDALTKWYQSSSTETVNMCHNRIFNVLLDLGSAGVQAISDIGLLETIQKKMTSLPDRESGILLIRYHIATDHLDLATVLFHNLHQTNLTRKRHAQLLLQAYVNTNPPQWSDAYEVFRLMIDSYPIPGLIGEDVLPFFDPDPAARAVVTQVLDLILGQPIQLGDGSIPDSWLINPLLSVFSVPNTKEHPELSIIDFTAGQISLLMDNLDTAFKQKGKMVKPDLSCHYDYIIDGANVMFFIERKITPHSYKRISRLLKTLRAYHQNTYGVSPRMLLVLHRRHLDPPQKFRRLALSEIKFWQNNLDICCTPKGVNDDYYALLNAFPRPKALLVTNDKFRDHIFKLSSKESNLDLIRQWRAEKVIEYAMEPRDDGKVTLHMPSPYSFRVQKGVSGDYYIPICASDDTTWVRVHTSPS